jgi:hypothetical protein
MRGRASAGLVMAVIVLVALSEVVLPTLVASQVEASVSEALGGAATRVQARVSGRPALAMLFGRFRDVRLEVEGMHAAGLRLAQVTLTAPEVTLPVGKLPATEDEWAIALDGATVEALITEADVNAYLVASRTAASGADVEFAPGRAVMTAPLTIAGNDVQLTTEGVMKLTRNGRMLEYEMESVTIDDKAIPAFLVDIASEVVTVGVDLSGLPLGIRASSVSVVDNALLLSGRISQGV